MQHAIAGWPVTGCPFESQLERVTRNLRAGFRHIFDFFTNPAGAI